MVQWAVDALEKGWDSPALRILAGFDLRSLPSFSEANPYFDRALAELSITVPDRDDVIRQYVDELAHEILQDHLTPREAVATIHRVAITPLSHPADLQAWCYLDGGIDPRTLAPVDEPQLDERIREYALEWVGGRRNDTPGAA